jgi:hypothetical protein
MMIGCRIRAGRRRRLEFGNALADFADRWRACSCLKIPFAATPKGSVSLASVLLCGQENLQERDALGFKGV